MRTIGPNRLFWKLFIGFWLTLLATGIAVGIAVSLHQSQREPVADPPLARGPRAEAMLQAAASTLRYGGEQALRELLASEAFPSGPTWFRLLVVDSNGRDLFGRDVPPAALTDARERAAIAATSAPSRETRGVRQVSTADGRKLLLFVALSDSVEPAASGRSEAGNPSSQARQREIRAPRFDRDRRRGGGLPFDPVGAIIIGMIASLVFSGLLAWYLTHPIRHLRKAFADVSDGRLDTRVAPLMGRRADEIAGLGSDFDRMADRLQRLISAQRRLLHDVSHELRSPLARIQAAIGLLRQNPDRAAAMVERIERESHRLDALVGELLTLARLEAGTSDAPLHEIDLADLLAEVVEDAAFEAQTAGRTVRLVEDDAQAPLASSARPASSARVRGDPLRNGRGADSSGTSFPVVAHSDWLRRAFENVVRNAVRHTAEGTCVDVRLAASAREMIVVEIADRGPGVPEEELEAIFEPFRRGGSARSQDGHGLGLAIARRAVTAHAGSISATRREGGGLIVRIELPRATAGTRVAARARTTRTREENPT